MKQISFLIIGIVLLVILPAAYFCFAKILDREADKKSAINAAVIFFIVAAVTLIGAGNLYTYFINSEEGIVAERYVTAMLNNAENGDIDRFNKQTKMITHEIENRDDVFSAIQTRDLNDNQKLMISESRRTDDKGVRSLYIWLKDSDVCFDIGFLKQKKFYDVYSVALVSDAQLETILAGERFLPLN